jgi:hypothetical protein
MEEKHIDFFLILNMNLVTYVVYFLPYVKKTFFSVNNTIHTM